MPQLSGSLQQDGALVDVLVGLSKSDVQTIRKGLHPVPQPMPLRALIDCGAQVTCLDPAIIKALALPVHLPTLANMPAGVGFTLTAQHRASVTIVHTSGIPRLDFVAADLAVCDLPLGLLGFDVVIGRDILDRLRFIYDGPGRKFSLDY